MFLEVFLEKILDDFLRKLTYTDEFLNERFYEFVQKFSLTLLQSLKEIIKNISKSSYDGIHKTNDGGIPSEIPKKPK